MICIVYILLISILLVIYVKKLFFRNKNIGPSTKELKIQTRIKKIDEPLTDIHNQLIEKFIKNYTKPIETPYTIGIFGGSGSGKTFVCEIIAGAIHKMFPTNPNDIVIISQDSYYFGGNSKTNYDIPSAIDFKLLISHMHELINGNSIECPIYDFKTHSRKKETITIHPSKIIIVDGILIGTQEELRNYFDMKIFVNSKESTQVFRRLERDVKERGRTIEEVSERYQRDVAPSYQQYVLPSAQFADMIINNNNGEVYIGLEAVLNHIMTIYKNITG